jgi:hypothetical protein
MKTSVTIYWQDNVIFHQKTSKFSVGEEKSDFILPCEKLGANNWKLLDNNKVFIPPGATSEYKESILDIADNKRIELKVHDFRILVQSYEEDYIVSKFDLSEVISNKIYIGLSGVAHMILMCAFAFFMPPLGLAEAEEAQKDQLFLIQQYLRASAEREQEAKEENNKSVSDNGNEGGTGKRAVGEEGSMGNPNSRQTNKSYAIKGPSDNKDIKIAREAALNEAKNFGLIGVLNSGVSGSDGPTAPWGESIANGKDLLSARGNMWGADPGEAYGIGGLGLSGIGESGGGRGFGIGVGDIGTIGHGAGLGDKQGFGNGAGRMSGGHKVKTPSMRIGVTSVNGRLPSDVIQRIIRQNHGKFRYCFEAGLRSNPSLQGRVSVRFIIGRDGSVSNVSNGGSDLPDPDVVQCVIRSYYGLSFPVPDGGIVTVIYPIMFN